MADTFRCLHDLTSCPTCPNWDAQYFLLGDSLFPVMLAEVKRAEKFIFVEYFIVEPGKMWGSTVEIMAENIFLKKGLSLPVLSGIITLMPSDRRAGAPADILT